MIIDANTVFGFWPSRRSDISAETLLRIMDEHGVERACAVSAKGILYQAREGNEETLALSRKEPRIIPAATIDPRKYLDCLEEIERCREAGFRMFHLFPENQSWNGNSAAARRVIRHLGKLGLPVMVSQAGGVLALSQINQDFSAPLIFSQVNYGSLPEVLAVMEENQNVYLETSLLNPPGAVEMLVDMVGPERLIFGSEAPLSYMGSTLKTIQSAQISEEDRSLILGGNIARLLGLTSGL